VAAGMWRKERSVAPKLTFLVATLMREAKKASLDGLSWFLYFLFFYIFSFETVLLLISFYKAWKQGRLGNIAKACGPCQSGKIWYDPRGRPSFGDLSLAGTPATSLQTKLPSNFWRTHPVAPQCKGLWLPLTSLSWKGGDGKGNN